MTPGLGQHDAKEDVPLAKTERQRRQPLSGGHRIERRPQSLGGIAGKQQRECEHATGERAELHILACDEKQHLGRAEVDEQHHQQLGQATDQGGQCSHRPHQPRLFTQLGGAQSQRQYHATDQ